MAVFLFDSEKRNRKTTSVAALCWRYFERHYFIVTLANARAAGTFEGALGPDCTPKASLVKACRNSSISAGVIGLFIFFILLAVGRWGWAIGNSPVLHALGIGRMSPRFRFVSFVSGSAKTTRGHEQIASGTPAGDSKRIVAWLYSGGAVPFQ